MDMRNQTVLVVDDEQLLRTLMTELLRQHGFQPLAVHSAEAALGVLKAQPIDLALLDISLPGKSGIELLETVTAEYPDTAVVMVTGIDEINTALRTMRMGAYDYVTKPFNEDELTMCVTRALERRQLTMENQAYCLNLERLVAARTSELEHALVELQVTADQTIQALGAALDLRDTETRDHCSRVAAYSVRLAKELNVKDENTLRNLRWGAYLHDIGKIGVPDAILMKPGSLTDEEYELIKKHPELGGQMLAEVPFLKESANVVQYHHERFDGAGYPKGVSGTDIPLVARIFSVADTVDAMTASVHTGRQLRFRRSGKR